MRTLSHKAIAWWLDWRERRRLASISQLAARRYPDIAAITADIRNRKGNHRAVNSRYSECFAKKTQALRNELGMG